MSKSVYISAPVSLDRGTVVKYYEQLSEVFRVNIWKRGTTYDYSMVHNSDIFVLLTPHNSWTMNKNYLPSGCARELKEAIALDKPIYLGYQTQSGDVYIYETDIYGTTLTGVAGTGGSIFRTHGNITQPREASDVDERVMEVEYDEPIRGLYVEYDDYDRRLLLLR